MRFKIYPFLIVFFCHFAYGQQNDLQNIKRIPALGIQLSVEDSQELTSSLKAFEILINELKSKPDQFTKNLLPDVLIYYKAVDYALKYQEFFDVKEVASARKLLKEGMQRANELKEGKASWTTQKGEVVRGYISKIDGSVQPYGLSIPENYNPAGVKFNLALWFHGRGENLSELNFISNGKGFFPAMPEMKNTIMLYPYGRYCNAFKFAGEVDVLEAMEAVKQLYSINNQGIIDRGFSMGGAAAWQFAVHYPDLWLAANPGAGFAETQDFLKVFSKQIVTPTWYEKQLWHLYDCTDYASNLSNLPLIAYNGALDGQKQAADVMEIAMKKEGLALTRITGPNIGHAYHKASAKTVDSLLAIVATNGKTPTPKELHFTTYTLKYNKMYWLTIEALKEHWEKTRVDALINKNTIGIKTLNITSLTLQTALLVPLINPAKELIVKLDGKSIRIEKFSKLKTLNFHLENNVWVFGKAKAALVKAHNLQGPIDDAFMSAFIIVKPTGKSKNVLFEQWCKAEMDRFIIQWRRQFRGDPIIKNDVDILPADLASNLILFGDATSNKVIDQIKNKSPLKWDNENIRIGKDAYTSKDHALIMVYPNPLNPKRYVVLNSGFTFREEAFLNNAKQVPMLPDWAIVDLNTPPDAANPGKIVKAGFFNEQWQLKK
jgi:poly(3-hydroxybutyrate) depolymerase